MALHVLYHLIDMVRPYTFVVQIVVFWVTLLAFKYKKKITKQAENVLYSWMHPSSFLVSGEELLLSLYSGEWWERRKSRAHPTSATRNLVASDRLRQIASCLVRAALLTGPAWRPQAPFQCCYWQHDWEGSQAVCQLGLHRTIRGKQEIKCFLFQQGCISIVHVWLQNIP